MLNILKSLTLRHEDTLNAMTSESPFLIFLSLDKGSIVPRLLIQQTKEWKDMDPSERPAPLRVSVLRVLLEELTTRLTKLQTKDKSTELIAHLQKLHYLIVDPEYKFPFMRWGSELQQYESNQRSTPHYSTGSLHSSEAPCAFEQPAACDQIWGFEAGCADSADVGVRHQYGQHSRAMEARSCHLPEGVHGSAGSDASIGLQLTVASGVGPDAPTDIAATRSALGSNIRCIWGPFVAFGVSLVVVLMGPPVSVELCC